MRISRKLWKIRKSKETHESPTRSFLSERVGLFFLKYFDKACIMNIITTKVDVIMSSIMTTASGASLWRGYEYYREDKVLNFRFLDDGMIEGEVMGSRSEPYHVLLDPIHLRRSKCNCPHADGKRIVCKHAVALFFTVFPDEAEAYLQLLEEVEMEEEREREERYNEIVKYVRNLTKEELRTALIQKLWAEEEARRYYW